MPWLGNIKDAVFDRCQRRMLMMESVGWYAHQLRDTHPPLVPPLRLHDTNAPFWHSSSALPREKPIEVLYAGQFLGWMDGWMVNVSLIFIIITHMKQRTRDFFLAMQHTQHWHIFPHIFICYIYKKPDDSEQKDHSFAGLSLSASFCSVLVSTSVWIKYLILQLFILYDLQPVTIFVCLPGMQCIRLWRNRAVSCKSKAVMFIVENVPRTK